MAAFEAMSTAVTYSFTSNANVVLRDIAKYARNAATSLDRLAIQVRDTRKAIRAFEADAGNISRVFSRMSITADGFGASVDRAMGQMTMAANAAAGRVDMATRSMTVGFDALTASARAANVAVRQVRPNASATRSFGVGAAGGAAAARAGASTSGAGGGEIGLSGGLGLAALATTLTGVRGQANLQQDVTRLAVQQGRTREAVNADYTPTAIGFSNRTGMKLDDTFGVINEVSGVIKNRQELRNSLLGENGQGGILDFVNVLKQNKISAGSPHDIAKNVVTVDHILNAYTAPAMARVQEKLYRAAVGSHMEINPLVTQLGYFGEQFRLASGGRAGATDDIFKLAELGYWGIGRGKWGSGFGQILRTIGNPPKNHLEALRQLGVLDEHNKMSATTENAAGEFTPIAMIQEARRRTRGMKPLEMINLVNRALPANAARPFTEAMSQKTTDFLARLDKAQANMPDLMTAETMGLYNLNDQTQRLYESFKNLATVLAGPLIKPLTDFMMNASNVVGKMTTYFQGHPAATAAASTALVAGAGFGALKLAELVGGFHAFAHLAAHEAKHGLGVGGGLWMRRGGHAAGQAASHGGGIMGAVRDMFSFKGLRGAAGSSVVGDLFKGLGSAFMRQMPGLAQPLGAIARIFTGVIGHFGAAANIIGSLGDVIFGLGRRAIPVVGEIFLAIDAMKFLGAHAKDIGWILGRVTRYIITQGVPMLFNAFKDAVVFIANGIKDTFVSLFTGGNGGLVGFIKSVVSGWLMGWKEGDPPPTSARGSRPGSITNHGAFPVNTGTGGGFDAPSTPAGGHRQRTRRVAGPDRRTTAAGRMGGRAVAVHDASSNIHVDTVVVKPDGRNDMGEVLRSTEKLLRRGAGSYATPTTPAALTNPLGSAG